MTTGKYAQEVLREQGRLLIRKLGYYEVRENNVVVHRLEVLEE